MICAVDVRVCRLTCLGLVSVGLASAVLFFGASGCVLLLSNASLCSLWFSDKALPAMQAATDTATEIKTKTKTHTDTHMDAFGFGHADPHTVAPKQMDIIKAITAAATTTQQPQQHIFDFDSLVAVPGAFALHHQRDGKRLPLASFFFFCLITAAFAVMAKTHARTSHVHTHTGKTEEGQESDCPHCGLSMADADHSSCAEDSASPDPDTEGNAEQTRDIVSTGFSFDASTASSRGTTETATATTTAATEFTDTAVTTETAVSSFPSGTRTLFSVGSMGFALDTDAHDILSHIREAHSTHSPHSTSSQHQSQSQDQPRESAVPALTLQDPSRAQSRSFDFTQTTQPAQQHNALAVQLPPSPTAAARAPSATTSLTSDPSISATSTSQQQQLWGPILDELVPPFEAKAKETKEREGIHDAVKATDQKQTPLLQAMPIQHTEPATSARTASTQVRFTGSFQEEFEQQQQALAIFDKAADYALATQLGPFEDLSVEPVAFYCEPWATTAQTTHITQRCYYNQDVLLALGVFPFFGTEVVEFQAQQVPVCFLPSFVLFLVVRLLFCLLFVLHLLSAIVFSHAARRTR